MSWQNRLNGIVLVVAVLLASSLCVANAKAIGLTPGRTTVDFEPNLEKTITFTIINNEHKEFRALIYVEGDLMDSVILDKTIVDFKETDNSKEFQFKYRMPDKIDKPGEYWTKVVVMEMPAGMEAEKLEGQFVIATTAVVHQVKVKVPYPGKYVDLEMAINEAEPGGTTMFFVKILNVGTEKVYKAFATLDILGPTNEKIDSIESDVIAVEAKNSGEIVIPWVANVNPGLYHAVVTLNYDGQTAKIERNFGVGALRIEVLDVKVRNFVLGGIAKFEINVENKWNQKIENVFAEMVINKENGDHVASPKSASIDIESLQRATLYAYWDTEGVDKGVYDVKMILHYADKTAEKMLKTNVQLESIETEFVGITARAVTAQGGPGPGADYLVPLVLIMVMINAGWFFYFRRKKK